MVERLQPHLNKIQVDTDAFLIHDSFTLPFGNIPDGPAFFYPLNTYPDHDADGPFGNMRHVFTMKQKRQLVIFLCDIPIPGSKRAHQLRDLFQTIYVQYPLSDHDIRHNKKVFHQLDQAYRRGDPSYNIAQMYLRPNHDIKQFHTDNAFKTEFKNHLTTLYHRLQVPPSLQKSKEWSCNNHDENVLSKFMKSFILHRMKRGVFSNAGSDFMKVACDALPWLDGLENCGYLELVLCRPKEVLQPYAGENHDEIEKNLKNGRLDGRSEKELMEVSPYLEKLFEMFEQEGILTDPEVYRKSFLRNNQGTKSLNKF